MKPMITKIGKSKTVKMTGNVPCTVQREPQIAGKNPNHSRRQPKKAS